MLSASLLDKSFEKDVGKHRLSFHFPYTLFIYMSTVIFMGDQIKFEIRRWPPRRARRTLRWKSKILSYEKIESFP